MNALQLSPWQFSHRCYSWGATSENRAKMDDFAPTRSFWSKISGTRGRLPPVIFARLVMPMNVLQLCPESFHTNVTAEKLRAKIERKSTISHQRGPWFKISGTRGRPHQSFLHGSLGQWMPYNVAADHFHTKKLCSRLSSSEVRFFTQIGSLAFLPRTRSSDENSVCLSVSPSVTRVHCDKTEERSVQIFIPYERTCILVFWEEERLVGDDPFYLKFWVNRPPLERNHPFWTDNRS